MGKKVITKKISLINKKAKFNFEILNKYTAGIVLFGSEIKSLRNSKASINEAYCYTNKGELWLKGAHISEYKFANQLNHEETRTRKLLLSKKEIKKLIKSKEKGLTIIPLKLFINPAGLAKIYIALAKGKNIRDKRRTIKERDLDRKMKADILKAN